MIDTVILSIPIENIFINDPQRFNPSFIPFNPYDDDERIRFLSDYKGLRKYRQNPPTSSRESGIIYPNLTIFERMRNGKYSCFMHISFSCPKLIWGHSFEEVLDNHFSLIVDTLITRLNDMNIVITKQAIENAQVQTLHFCANIMFPSEEDTRIFLNRLQKTSLQAWFEKNEKSFANDGRTVRFHTDIFEINFYLKYYDILEKYNRRVNRKVTLQEKIIAKQLSNQKKMPPVIRMEIRFNGVRSIGSHLKTSVGIDKQYWTFKEAFDSYKSRKTLLYYWNKIIDEPTNKILLSKFSDQDICEKVIRQYPNEMLKTILEGMGLFYALKSLGAKRLKGIITIRQNRKAWYDKRKKITNFAKNFSKSDESLIKNVTSVLENKPLQLGLPI